MNAHPPTRLSLPVRRHASGRRAGVGAVVLLLWILGGCGSVIPPPAATGSPPAASTGPSREAPRDMAGLLVADGGPLRVTTADGDLEPFDAQRDQARTVTSGGGGLVVVDGQLFAWHAPDPGAGARDWRRLPLATDRTAIPPLVALAPQGRILAALTGEPAGRRFDLELLDIARSSARSIRIAAGLNGPPAWLGPSTVAVNVIGADQHSGFVAIDTATDAVTDLASFGYVLAASADGSVVALDESASGDVLVGARTDMTAEGIARMTRIRGPAGLPAADVALSAEGTRLAIVSRSDTRTSLELLGLVDGAWRSGRTLTFDGVAVVSIAWLR